MRGYEFQAGPGGQSTCKTVAEARIGIDAGADRGAAKCELQQTRLRRIEPFDAVADLACPARQLLVETDRHCIHQVRAAGLGHALELACALLDRGREQLQRRLEFEIGRASCRERVCQCVEISVVAVSLKKKKQ